ELSRTINIPLLRSEDEPHPITKRHAPSQNTKYKAPSTNLDKQITRVTQHDTHAAYQQSPLQLLQRVRQSQRWSQRNRPCRGRYPVCDIPPREHARWLIRYRKLPVQASRHDATS